MIREHAPRPSALFAALLFAVLSASQGAAASGKNWHQYYEPIEDPAVREYVLRGYREALKRYGPPIIPVREIHLRRSIPRQPLTKLARADVTDWKLFIGILAGRRETGPHAEVWARLPDALRKELLPLAAVEAEEEPVPWETQIKVVRALNRMIEAEDFSKAGAFESLNLPEPRRGFLGLFKREDPARRGRQILARVFPGMILETPETKAVRNNFQLCECIDEAGGKFVLYAEGEPGEDIFYLQMGHEVAHLLNPYLYDWYVEGLNTVFAEELARQAGYSFSPWGKRFHRNRTREPYAVSYYMMKEVQAAAGEDLRSILRHAVVSGRRQYGDERRRIDIDAWLATLPAA